jgi:putative hemolysin
LNPQTKERAVKNMAKIHRYVLIGLVMVALNGCSAQQSSSTVERVGGGREEIVGMANPASTYCVDQGNTLEIRTDSEGGQVGICIFPDGSECEEWAYMRGECGPGEAAASETGSTDTVDMVQVAGWMGYVVSTPDGAEFDDYVVLAPDGVGEFGIAGATPELEAKIVDLRDQEEPGKFANFWGTLTCNVRDYNDCQMLVEQIRVGTEITDPEPVEGWVGTLVSTQSDSQFDDRFVLSGRYPVEFGIASAVGPSEEYDLSDELEALRDTGTVVRVTGNMVCGVPDVNACQIQVTLIESVS